MNITAEEFAELMRMLFASFPIKKWSDTEKTEITDSFFQTVRLFRCEDVEFAFDKATKKERFPNSGQIFSYCKENMNQRDEDLKRSYSESCGCSGDGWLPRKRVIHPTRLKLDRYGKIITVKNRDENGNEIDVTVMTRERKELFTYEEWIGTRYQQEFDAYMRKLNAHSRSPDIYVEPEELPYIVGDCVVPCQCRISKDLMLQGKGGRYE